MYAVTGPRISAVFVALLQAAACAGSDAAGDWLVVGSLSSPAGEGSGEPFLSTSGDTVNMSWLEPDADRGHALMLARLWNGEWSEPTAIVRGRGFFVNWADLPSVTSSAAGTLWAHWLVRGPAGGYDYGIRLASSDDGGLTWTSTLVPHEDGTPTEHGFLSAFPVGEGMGFVWLDGRRFAAGPDGAPPSREMTLRYRAVDARGAPGPERLLDDRVCDCCQTSAAMTDRGPVVVYRNRGPDEVRDVFVTRLVHGAWTPGTPVHIDGWRIDGCPVNGPAAAARGEMVAVAWFTGAGDVPSVRLAHSTDAGATFGAPHPVDDGNPVGRVDVVIEADGDVLVTWLERTGGGGAEIRVRRIAPDGSATPSVTVADSDEARGSGFPRLALTPDGRGVVAWTDARAGRVRVATLMPRGLP